MQNDNARQSDMERRLSQVESPEPPAGLLERLRDDIPEYLRPVTETEAAVPPVSRRYRLLAASVLVAVVGGFLAYRVFREAPAPISSVATEQRREEVPPPPATTAPPAATLEVGVGAERTAGDYDTAEGAAVPTYPPVTRAEEPVSTEATASQQLQPTADEYRAAALPERPTSEALDVATQSDPGSAAPTTSQLTRAVPILPEDRERLRALGQLPDAGRGMADSAAPPQSETVKVKSAMVRPRQMVQAPEEQVRRLEVGVRLPPPAPGTFSGGPSTGGTAEPNDQPWGDMFFRPYGTNPFVDTEDDPQSTFGLDVDTGSYTLARGYLERGHLPPAEAIRVEEFVNFFDYRDPAPRRGEFALTAEGAPSPWRRGPRYQLLRVGVHGREISASQRRDATLIFVVDVSGSMARDNRIELVKRALHLLLDQLGDGDRVGLVVYGSRGQVLLEPSSDLETVRRAVDRLSTGGSTNAEEGLVLAYDLARRHLRPESINRLVLCSDGVANVGRTGPESILARIGREAEEGIELTTVGFGMGNYNDVLMEQLADRGDGNYAYVDTLQEARRVFVENLTGTLQTIAADAKIQVEFDPRVVTRYRLLGYENRDVADHRFRDDTVDAGEIGAGHQVTALYELKLADGAPRRQALAQVRLRYRSKASGQIVEESLEVRQSQLAHSWRAASPALRLAALAAELAEVLRRSYWARETRPAELLQRAQAVSRDFSGDDDVAGLVDLTRRTLHLVEWPETPPE